MTTRRSGIDLYGCFGFVLPFAVYLQTLAPSVTFFDSGEFLTAIYSLGSAHSPGYPFFINFAKPFTWLPLGNIAFRVNVATAVSASLAAWSVYFLTVFLIDCDMERLRSHLLRGAALAAALVFAFSPRLWLQSNHDKPYPLISFLAALILYLLLRWRRETLSGTSRPALIYLATFLWGLGFAAHQTMILIIPACVFLVFVTDRSVFTEVKEAAIAFFFAILGLSLHLHLAIRASRKPLLNWGDPSGLKQFLWHFLRKGYPVEKPQRTLELVWAQMNALNIPRELTVAGFLLAAVAIVLYWKRLRTEIAAYGLILASFVGVIVWYLDTPSEFIFLTEEFFTPVYLFSAVFLGAGLFAAADFVVARLAAVTGKPGAVVTATFLLVCLPVLQCAGNYYENDQHENYIAFDYAGNSLRSLPPHTVFFTWGDSGAFPLWYLQGVEKMREDVDLLHTPHLVFDWYLEAFPQVFGASRLSQIPLESLPPESALMLVLSEQIGSRPVYVDFSTRYSVAFDPYLLQQHGIVYQIIPAAAGSQKTDMGVWDLYFMRGLYGAEMPFRDLDTGKAILIYANSHLEYGDSLLREGRNALAFQELRRAELLDSDMRQQVVRTLRMHGLR